MTGRDDDVADLRDRGAPLDMAPDTFREIGHELVDRLADFIAGLDDRPAAPDESPTAARALIGEGSIPTSGMDAGEIINDAADILTGHSVLTGHPRFWAYVNGSASPLGSLGDLLAAVIDPNLASWPVGTAAAEIERQTVRWIAELLGYSADCGGLLVSGGAMANYIGLLAARRHHASWDIRAQGFVSPSAGSMLIYTTRETHAWILKAADAFGMGTDAIRWVPTDDGLRMRADALAEMIVSDRAAGQQPFLVVGTAGTVSTGAVDPLPAIAEICRQHDLWFHVDGAYGGLAVLVPDAPEDLRGLSQADSIAIDQHKWMYASFEAACVLVREPDHLTRTFGYATSYYPSTGDRPELPVAYRDWGLQSTRGFRALKVWLALKQAGRGGYAKMLSDDMRLARYLYRRAQDAPTLQACTNGLSITTFRYVPEDIDPASPGIDDYLNDLNEEVLRRVQASGVAYPSHARLGDSFVIRVCITNFRTTPDDIDRLIDLVTELGSEIDRELRA